MPPMPRSVPAFQSQSTPNLPTRNALQSRPPVGESTHPAHALVEDISEDGDDSEDDDGDNVPSPILIPSGESDLDSDSGAEAPLTARPLHMSRSYSHLAPQPTNTLFPPFYNRPPTPLPPSPSLTSLLRPSFSTNTSRPTTPDSSDIDIMGTGRSRNGGTNTPGSSSTNLASITKSARHAPTVPRASPKIPTYEYYGFAMYVTSSAALLLYIVWAYVPAPMLHQMGIHYYPNRWWALAVPCWLSVLVVYIYVALASYNTTYLTLPLSSCENLVDETGHVAVVDRRTGKIARKDAIASLQEKAARSGFQFGPNEDVDWKSFWSISTDAVLDVPIGGVCEILYGGDDNE